MLRELNYTHPIELLTMYFCLFGDKAITNTSMEQLREVGLEEVVRARVAYRARTQVTACPAIALRDAKKSAKEQKKRGKQNK